jgi:hypothetical protein
VPSEGGRDGTRPSNLFVDLSQASRIVPRDVGLTEGIPPVDTPNGRKDFKNDWAAALA